MTVKLTDAWTGAAALALLFVVFFLAIPSPRRTATGTQLCWWRPLDGSYCVPAVRHPDLSIGVPR